MQYVPSLTDAYREWVVGQRLAVRTTIEVANFRFLLYNRAINFVLLFEARSDPL